MKKVSNMSNLSLMAYQNSYNIKNKTNTNEDIIGFDHKNHKMDKSKLMHNLQQENDLLKERISFVIEKDRELAKIKIENEKYKNIIGKYNIDSVKIDTIKMKNDTLIKQIDEYKTNINDLNKNIDIFKKTIELLKKRLISIVKDKDKEYLLKLEEKNKKIELLKKKIISIISEKDNEYLSKLDDKEKTILLLKKRLIEIMNDIDLNNVTIEDIDIDLYNDIE